MKNLCSALSLSAFVFALLPATADVMSITEKVTLDGKLDEPFWAKADWQGDFKHLAIRQDARPLVNATEFALVADATTLYLGIKCHETQVEKLRALGINSLWCADGLEIFFCPSGRSFDFYQFVVPYRAEVGSAQMFASESGNITPDPYAAPWRAERAEVDDGWTLEIAIPFSSFYMTRNDAWSGEWLFNLCRNCETINERSSWSQLYKAYREPARFGKIAGFPMRRAADDVAMTDVLAELTERRDGMMVGCLRFNAHVAEAGVYTVVSPVVTTTDVTLEVGRNKVSVPCAFASNGRHPTELTLVRKATGERYSRTYPVRVDFEEIRVKLTSPEYRDNFYPGQDSTTVKGEVKVAVKGEVKLTLEGPGIPKIVRVPDAAGAFSFDTSDFAVGEAVLTVEAGTAKKIVKIRKLAPTGHCMSWVSKGCLVVDGQPVFRRGVYSPGYRRSEAFKERLDADKRLYLTPLANTSGGTLEPNRVIPGLEPKEARSDVYPCAEYLRKLDKLIEQGKDKDFVSYYISDEPECRRVSPVYLRHVYEYMKEKDPNHVILASTRDGKSYIDCADWLETHPYLGPYFDDKGRRCYTNPPNRIGNFIDDFGAADRPDKCIGFLPMMFAYRSLSPLNDYPTFPEYVCHVWAALLRGARSFNPYAEHDMGDRPSIYEGNRYVNSTAEGLQEFLLGARRTTLLKTSEAECVRWDLPSGAAMFALVNMKTEPQAVTVPTLTGTFREFRGARMFDCKDAASATFALEPLGVIVGTTDVRGAGLETYAEVKALVDRLEYERTHRDNQIFQKSTEMSIKTSRGKGEYYKLVDGVYDMLAFQQDWSASSFVEIDFKKTLIFPKVRVYGNHLEHLAAAIWKDGTWQTLTPKAVKTEKWMRELDFGESVSSEKLRLTFADGKNAIRNLEVYEVEIGKNDEVKPEIVDGTHGYYAENYVEVTDPLVKAELEKFKDRKLALMIHFGIYSQLGIHESWPLVDDEAAWSRAMVDWTDDGELLKRQYLDLWKSFNPVRLQPERWASLAKENGFKYLVFTTKHHDGFCLFDSKYSDFKVTNPTCPYSNDPKADIVKHVFDAFRAEGLAISCYFSKPDWHHPDYWDNCGLGWRTTRMPSYDVSLDPTRWDRFATFLKNQILELVGNYGPIDCLWLDGGCVQRKNGLEIHIEEIVNEARKLRPGLVAADRVAGGMAENIITPEQTVPEQPLPMPWESCVTMGTGFSYRFDETFKSPRELITLLIDVVAKGGNLALNVAPGPDGRLPQPAIDRMQAMGTWLKQNGEAIYATRVCAPYRTKGWAFTRSKDGATDYAIRLWGLGLRHVVRLTLPTSFDTHGIKRVTHLATGTEIPVVREGETCVLRLPDALVTDPVADAFRFER